jgi:broad specificity phosphatase PhoE
VAGRHTGSTDLALLPEGEAQARALGRKLTGRPFARVMASPLLRARETARLAGFGDRVEITELLREWNYGAYEGLTGDEIRVRSPGWEVFRDGCPDGEGPAEVTARAEKLLTLIGDPGGDVLLFGHGHCLRALAAIYLTLPMAHAAVLRLDAGTLSILGLEHDHRAILLWNSSAQA